MSASEISYVDGFEVIWIVWMASCLIVLLFTVAAFRRLRWAQIRRIFLREDGAAYTLSYVMVMPIYVLFVCLVIETSFMLVAKIGTVYSAFAAARCGAVWYSAAESTEAEQRSRDAGIRAFVPFSSGLAGGNLQAAPPGGQSQIQEYLRAYREYAAAAGVSPASERYLRNKYAYARQAVDVQLIRENGSGGQPWDEDLTATVTYQYPFNVVGIGRILGQPGSNGGYIYEIASRVTLQVEHPWNEEQRLGISYASPE